jgi:amidase
MADETLTRRSARELVGMIKARAVSPLEVLDAHLAAIGRLNPELNAIVTLAPDQARADAHAVETALVRG